MDAVTRCKMRVSSVMQEKAADGTVSQEIVQLSAVYSNDPNNENSKWCKWTPCAEFKIYINNPEAFNKLSKGHEYFVDFTPAEAAK